MSSKKELTDKIISLLRTLPKDRLNYYSSFKEVQLQRFQNLNSKDLDHNNVIDISEKDLRLQYDSLRDLVNDKYKNYYKLDDKLLKPKGNPIYYDRLLSSIKGERKETLWEAARTVVFGR
ncbi:hypothetical protein DFJ63DRAFT_89840 [Scheffersomyces coipomensis]|uniref:uncharacterized protein n=1 Tax=Scheffersomyces coipomensis TaxID=1788519 RepID=UPI00315DEF83